MHTNDSGGKANLPLSPFLYSLLFFAAWGLDGVRFSFLLLVDALKRGSFEHNLKFLQWIHSYVESNYPTGVYEYPGFQRRAQALLAQRARSMLPYFSYSFILLETFRSVIIPSLSRTYLLLLLSQSF